MEFFAPRLLGDGATPVGREASLLDGWTASCDAGGVGLISLSNVGDGVRLVAPADAVGVMLRRPLAGPVASRGAAVRVTLRVRTSDARALKQSLVNLSVSGAIAGRRRTLIALHASAFRTKGTETLLVTFEATWPPRATAVQIELRFRRQAIDHIFHGLEMETQTVPRRRGAVAGRGVGDNARFVPGREDEAPGPSAWSVRSPDADGPAPAVRFGPDGLHADFTASQRPVVVTRALPLPPDACGKMLRIDLFVRADDAAACQTLMSQIAISLASEGKTPRNLFRLSPALAYPVSETDLRLIVEAACLGEMTHCVIELTFHGDHGSLSLQGIDAALTARAEDRGRAATRPTSPGAPTAPGPKATAARKVVVVGWQLADNAVGRAYVLADMLHADHATEIVGPLFGPEGVDLWEPLRTTDLPMRSFTGGAMRSFLTRSVAFAADVDCDVAYVSKPRLPALLLALLIHHRTGCGLVLDIDDHELSFFAGAEGVALDEAVMRVAAQESGAKGTLVPGMDDADADAGDDVQGPSGGDSAWSTLADADRPDGALWTSVAETLIATFEDRTVSNAALRARYGGLVVRHARDETVFRPDPALRARIRDEFSISASDRVVLFMGTPRRHKGLERLVAALHRVDDPRLRLVVVGTISDRGMQRDLLAFPKARISLFPNQPWQRLPEISQIADGVCLLQDPDSPIARYQIPAKLTDALAVGVPVATTRVAPLADTPPSVVTYIDDDEALDRWLRTVAAGEADAAEAEGRIAWFHEELGYRVNRARIEAAVDRCLARPRVWKPAWTALFAALNRCYGVGLPEEPPAWAGASRGAAEIPAPAVRRPAALDLVCFWKQNDTGLYGRRHDMLMRYLRQSERVRSLLVFDAPIRVAVVEKASHRGPGAPLDHAKLTADATIRRFLELEDERDVRRRVFVYGDKPGQSFYGRTLDTLEGYADYVSQQLPPRSGARRLAWAWPVAAHFAELCETVGFDEVVVDLVDDERAMTQNADRRAVLETEYRRTLARADVIFANCETLRDRFPDYRDAIRVVPNACEMPGEAVTGVPHDIAHLPGPIIGYVGNLRSRIDVSLVEALALRHPEWSIVLVGSAHGSPEVLRLQGLQNVHFLGPRPYRDAQDYIRRFDVAIMPHLRNALSDSMNPLKLYVYVALGKRVVTSRVGNIDELRDHIDIAETPADFLAKVELAVAHARFDGADRPLSREALWKISWQQRVATMLAAIA